MRSVNVAEPCAPPQVLTEVAVRPDTSITGTPGTPIRALATVEVAVDVSGASVVVTLAHNAFTVNTRVLTLAVHGVVVLSARAVRICPVSGVGGRLSDSSSRRIAAEAP